jgi:hypothetical protein
MLGSVVARYFEQRGATVWTTDLRYDGSDALPSWAARFDLTVNCIRSDDWREMVDLPAYLSMSTRGQVISPSTDAIRETTEYARMKREAETNLAITIRCGIVDVEHQPETAYTNWYCNPLTPLEWAAFAWRLREAKPGVYQAGREPLSRYDVARTVAQIWHRPEPTPALGEPSDRVLSSRWTFQPLDEALGEFRAWLS